MSASTESNELVSPAGPGSQVERLNRLPYAAGLLLILLVLFSIGWAIYQRATPEEKTAVSENKPIKVQNEASMVDALMAKFEGIGVIEGFKTEVPPEVEAAGKIPTQTVVIDTTSSPPPQPKVEKPGNTAPITTDAGKPPELTAEELAAKQRLEQARQQAFQLYLQALTAPTAVQAGMSRSTGENKRQEPGDYLQLHQQAMQQQQQYQQALLQGLGSLSRSNNGVQSRFKETVGGRVTERGGRHDDYGYSNHQVQRAQTATELRVGTVIPAVMISGINSDLPGEMLAQVTEAVRDSQQGQYVLIPQGAKLVGRYASDIAEGQERVMVVWYRLNFPDGSFLNLDGMNGMDLAGFSGLHDKVNRHTVDKFKEATLLSLITGAAQLSQTDNDEAAQQLAAALGQQWGQVGQEVVKRKLERSATLEIRPGYRFNVFINKDLMLKPYQPKAPASFEVPMSLRG